MGRKRNKKGGKDEGNAAAEVAMEKAVQRVQVILKEHSEQEIRETLLQCNLNHNVAIDRLLSQQDAKNKQGASNQFPDSSTTATSIALVSTQSGLPIVLASSGEAVPLSSEPSSSAITNGVTKSVPVSSNVSVLPSSRALTTVTPMPKAPVKADDDSHLKPDATTNPIFNSAFPFNQPMDTRRQSIATASSSLGPKPPTSMADAFRTYTSYEPLNKQQAMNSQGQVPLGQYGNMINSPYWGPTQNESYDDMAPFKQRGFGSHSNTLAHHHVNMMNSSNTWLEQKDGTSIYECLNSAFAPYRNSTRPQSATSTVPSSHGSSYGFGNAANSRFGYEEDVSRNHLPSNSPSGSTPSSHGSAFGFDMTSGNGSNSRLGYEDISRTISPSNSSGTSRVHSSHGSDYGRGMSSGDGSDSRLGYEDDISRIHMPSVQGSRSPFVWRVLQGEDSYTSLSPRSQQQREAYFERITADLASSALEQAYNRRDQTQQWPRDK